MICSFITPYVYISLMYEQVTEKNYDKLFIYLWNSLLKNVYK